MVLLALPPSEEESASEEEKLPRPARFSSRTKIFFSALSCDSFFSWLLQHHHQHSKQHGMSVAEEEEVGSLGLRSSRVVHAQLAELGLERGDLLLLQLGVLGHQPQLPPQVLILRTRLLCSTITHMHGRSAP